MRRISQRKFAKAVGAKRMTEAEEQILCIVWFRKRYPKVPIHYQGSQVRTVGQKVKESRMGKTKSWPDIFIACCRQGWGGLFIEFKRTGTKIYKRNPDINGFAIPKDEHIEKQMELLSKLSGEVYAASFAVGFAEFQRIVSEYLDEKSASLE